MTEFFEPEDYELEKLKITELNKKTYYASVDKDTVKIYTVAPITVPAVAVTTSLSDLIGDIVKNYDLGTGDTPNDAVPFYVITGPLDDYNDYNVSDNFYILPSLTPKKIEAKIVKNYIQFEANKAQEHLQIEADRLEQERLAKIEADADADASIEILKYEHGDISPEEVRMNAALKKAEEQERLAKIEADKLAAEEAEQKRLAKIEADRVEAERVAEQKRLAKIEADRVEAERVAEQKRLAKIESDRISAEKAEEANAKRRGFPNFSSSCWALSIIHLFYETDDLRNHILEYKIDNPHNLFDMDIEHYIGEKSGHMLTQYHEDELKASDTELYNKMEKLFNTDNGTYRKIIGIQSVWGFKAFRDEVLKIVDDPSITNKTTAVQVLGSELQVKSEKEKKEFIEVIQQVKDISDINNRAKQMNEIFIYAFQILFKYTRGDGFNETGFNKDKFIKSLLVIPLIIFGEFRQQDNTEFVNRLLVECSITIDESVYNSKSQVQKEFFRKDFNKQTYSGDLFGITKFFSFKDKETKYYFNGEKCTDVILSQRDSNIYSLQLGVASEYKENDSINTYLDKENPNPNGSFFLPDETEFNRLNTNLSITYSKIKTNYEEIIKLKNILKYPIQLPNYLRRLIKAE